MRTKDDAKALVEKWAKAAGLDEDGVRKMISNESILEEARNNLAMHDELASGIDKARNESKAKLDELQRWYDTVAQPSVAEAERLRAAYRKYEDTYGPIDDGNGNGNGQPRNSNGQYVSRKDLDAVGLSAVQVGKQMAFITADYNSRFGQKFGPLTYEQVEEFEKFAVSRGSAPIQAYREWIAPKEKQLADEAKAAETSSWEAKLKAAREEGVREGQTRKQWGSEAARTTDGFGRDLKALKMDPADADKAGDEAFLEVMAANWDDPAARSAFGR